MFINFFSHYQPDPVMTTYAVGEEGGEATTLAVGEEGGDKDVSLKTIDYLKVAAEADNNGEHWGFRGDLHLTKDELARQIDVYNKQRELLRMLSGVFSMINPFLSMLFKHLDTQVASKLGVAQRLNENFDIIDRAVSGDNDGRVTPWEIVAAAKRDGNVFDLTNEDLTEKTIIDQQDIIA
jgi:hypothetical protein